MTLTNPVVSLPSATVDLQIDFAGDGFVQPGDALSRITMTCAPPS